MAEHYLQPPIRSLHKLNFNFLPGVVGALLHLARMKPSRTRGDGDDWVSSSGADVRFLLTTGFGSTNQLLVPGEGLLQTFSGDALSCYALGLSPRAVFVYNTYTMKNITIFTKPSKRAREVEQLLLAELEGLTNPPQKPIVIAIGGDGTMLMAIKEHELEDISFIGISAGHLGFLQTLKPEDIAILVDSLQRNSFTTILAPLLAVRYADSKEVLGYGFNDITIERSGPRAARFELHVDDNAGTFIGDGIIFSTPLGSTAYSLAAGGPIIDSRAQDVFVVSPSNPHVSPLYSSLQRPHVMQKGRIIKIESTTEDLQERPIQLSIDGTVTDKNIQQPVEVYVSDKRVSLLEIKEKDFHSRIDKKRLGNY